MVTKMYNSSPTNKSLPFKYSAMLIQGTTTTFFNITTPDYDITYFAECAYKNIRAISSVCMRHKRELKNCHPDCIMLFELV